MPYISSEARDKIHQRFINDISNHEMQILHEHEVYRHVMFKRPDTGCYHFSLITTPGTLLYTGDVGTFVFRRTRDMFQFFSKPTSSDVRHPDFSYWHEKLEAADKHDGSCSDSKEILFERLRDYLKDGDLCGATMQQIKSFIDELESHSEDKHFVELYREADQFYIGPNTRPEFHFSDLWDYNYKTFTDRFIWACYAIQWGVAKYFSHKQETQNGSNPATEEITHN